MRKLIVFALLMVVSTSALYAQKFHNEIEYPEINTFQMPEVVEFQLRNGIKVYMVENRELPLISMTARIRAGSYMEPLEKTGLVSLAGRMIRGGGTAKYSFDELNTLLESRAASIETGFALTSGTASLNVLKEDFDSLLPVWLDVIQNPAFPQERIDVVKRQISSGISRRNDDAGQIAVREFFKLIYGAESAYASETEFATLNAITRDDLVDFHKKVMVGRNITISIIGDFSVRDMRRKLERALADIPAGTANQLNLPAVDYTFEPGVNFIAKNDVNQSTIFMGHIGGRRSNPDYAALQLMNEILSSGFSGRLIQVIRTDMGLAYSAGGNYGSNPLYDGVFYVTLSTASANTAKAVNAAINEVKRIQAEPVTQQEIDDAKDRILNSLVFRYDSRAAVLNERVLNEYNGLPADAFNQYINQLGDVTIADVQRVAKEYLRPDALRVLIVGNENEMGDQLAEFGDVNRIDITIPQPVAARTDAGDAAGGTRVLNLMAKALSPEGVNHSIVNYKGVINQGGMALDANITMDFANKSLIQEINAPQGAITISYTDGNAKMAMGPNEQALPPQQAEMYQKELDRNYLNPALLNGDFTVEFLGNDENSENPVGKLFVPDLNLTFYVNLETGLPVKSVVKEFNPMAGQELEMITTYDNWTLADGVKFAYTSVTTIGGQTASSGSIKSHSAE
jgi:zinc protease